MIGLFLLAVLALYVCLLWKFGAWIIRRIPKTSTKIGVGIGIVALAFGTLLGDEVVGQIYFDKAYCQEEAGFKYFKKTSLPDGLLLEFVDENEANEWLQKRGLKFVETKYYDGFHKYFLDINGSVKKEDNKQQAALLGVVREQGFDGVSIRSDKHILKNFVTNEVYAQYSEPRFRGGWVSRNFPLMENPKRCIGSRVQIETIEKTLIKSVFGINK